MENRKLQSLREDIQQAVDSHYMYPVLNRFDGVFGEDAVHKQISSYHIIDKDTLIDHLKGYLQTVTSDFYPHTIDITLVEDAVDKINKVDTTRMSHWIVDHPAEAGYLEARPVSYDDLSGLLNNLLGRAPHEPKWQVADLKSHVRTLYTRTHDIGAAIDFLFDYFGENFNDEIMYNDFQGYEDTINDLMEDVQEKVEEWTVASVDTDDVQGYLDKINQVKNSEVPYWKLSDGFQPIKLDDLLKMIDNMVNNDPSTVKDQ